MKQVLLYSATLIVAGVLSYLGEALFGAEWIFGLLTVFLFFLFLQGWKRWGRSPIGLVIITVCLLITLDGIFFVQYAATAICSLLMGLFLLPHFYKNKDGVAASAVFVFLNILICFLFVPNELMGWIFVTVTGITALIGFRYNLPFVRTCFVSLFGISAFFLLLFQLSEEIYMLSILAVLLVGFLIFAMYRMNRQAAA
ncbi:hypothetical protein [Planococcus halotolerans]|uniref:Uncharacterized protein n=1 Tax=Planococcus halotolerans TaxID=2233542 RepID=A0A365KXJ9_9BACL|nr:hypothetical protein [Planococcus halotolerans]QHJ72145.1 hypothetical protein DNR44_016745 [Planococcus halotolerans]RAZ77839.1 hypothetical protein DP120_10185 [Planococcus halotolerans]